MWSAPLWRGMTLKRSSRTPGITPRHSHWIATHMSPPPCRRKVQTAWKSSSPGCKTMNKNRKFHPTMFHGVQLHPNYRAVGVGLGWKEAKKSRTLDFSRALWCGKQDLKRGWPPEKVKKRKKTFVLQLCSKEQFELKKAQWEVLHSKCIQFFGVDSLLHDAVLKN